MEFVYSTDLSVQRGENEYIWNSDMLIYFQIYCEAENR